MNSFFLGEIFQMWKLNFSVCSCHDPLCHPAPPYWFVQAASGAPPAEEAKPAASAPAEEAKAAEPVVPPAAEEAKPNAEAPAEEAMVKAKAKAKGKARANAKGKAKATAKAAEPVVPPVVEEAKPAASAPAEDLQWAARREENERYDQLFDETALMPEDSNASNTTQQRHP